MSAIVGIYHMDGRPVYRGALKRMIGILAHRGPDRAESWSKGAIGLGHGMLFTTPESLHERQPLTALSGRVAITSDARIDNRDELIGRLGLADHPSGGFSDSRLILEAYEKWGEECPEKLLGDFAFAIWDNNNQRIFCARDHFGAKPFYYYRSERLFVFASEIKGLLCLPDVPCRLNELRVADYLQDLAEDKASTFFEGIWRLPPGHSMTVNREGSQLREYWSLGLCDQLQLGSDRDYADAFRELFTDAVRCRLRSAFPVGSLLSGGLDSSAVTCVARQCLAGAEEPQLHTFSAVFESDGTPECDERAYMQAVVDQGGVKSHWVVSDKLHPLTDMGQVLWHEDEPVWEANLFLSWALSAAARQAGCRALLNGAGGDLVLSTDPIYLSDFVSTGRWVRLIGEARAIAKYNGGFTWKWIWEYGVKPVAPDSLRHLWRRCRGSDAPDLRVNPLIDSRFARRVALADRIDGLNGHDSQRLRSARQEHHASLRSGVVPLVLEIADKAAAAFSLEPRYPFLDRRVVEFCLALPTEQKLRNGWTRMVLRRALEGSLPEEIRRRRGKGNYSRNFDCAFFSYGRDCMEEVMANDVKLIQDFVDVEELRRMYQRYLRTSGREESLQVWSVLKLAVWLRRTGLRV